MSSKVSKIERICAENKKNPIYRLYALEWHTTRGNFYCLLSETEWGFIYDGIINPPLRNILTQKDIYLEYSKDAQEYLAMLPEERALSIAVATFESKEEFVQYCSNNTIELINTFVIEEIKA